MSSVKQPEGMNAPRSITVRELSVAQQPFAAGETKYWCDGSVSVSEYFHTYSVLFPEGENFFVRSVMAYARDPRVLSQPQLKHDVKGFVSQEVHHASTHIHYNKMIASRYGHDMEGISSFVKSLLSLPERYRTFSDKKTNCLAITCSLEHLTATLGELLLNSASGHYLLQRMTPSHRALWIYHAIEEMEHKAVAFDVYEATDGRYLRRVWQHILSTALFIVVSTAVYLLFMWDAGHLFNVFTHLHLLNSLFIHPGFFREAIPMWSEYFQLSFHPWQKGSARFIRPWDDLLKKGKIITDADLEAVFQHECFSK